MHRHLLNGYRIEAPSQTVYRIAHLSGPPHATRPSLEMLAQRAERLDLDGAVQLWAPVYLLVVDRAFQMLIEAVESLERGVAQEALERQPIPGARRGPR